MKISAQYYAKLAEKATINDEIEKAIKYWTKAIELSPNNWRYYQERANLYRFGKAITLMEIIHDLSKVIELAKNKDVVNKALHTRAISNESMGLYEDAINDLQILREQKKLNDISYASLASIMRHKSEQTGNAIEILSEAILLFQNNPYLYLQRGFYYRDNGEYSKSVDDLIKIINFLPMNDAEVIASFYWLGHNYLDLGEYQKALENFTKVQQSSIQDIWPDLENLINMISNELKKD